MKKAVFFIAGLFFLASCTKNLLTCPKPPTETGLELDLPVLTGNQNNYRFVVFYEEPAPTPGSYFEVTVTPAGQAANTYKAYTDGLPHQLSDNSLGMAVVELSVPLSSQNFIVIRTGKLPPQLQFYCGSGAPSQPISYPNSGN